MGYKILILKSVVENALEIKKRGPFSAVEI
jgi:hypothetical protein